MVGYLLSSTAAAAVATYASALAAHAAAKTAITTFTAITAFTPTPVSTTTITPTTLAATITATTIRAITLFTSDPPLPLASGSTTRMVNAAQVVITVKIEGTLEDYQVLVEAINLALGQLLQCFEPHCFLTVTAVAGSVVLTVTATDIAEPPTIVSAANAIATADLSYLSAVLDHSNAEHKTSRSAVPSLKFP